MWWYERKILLTWRWPAFICACIHANIHHPCMHACSHLPIQYPSMHLHSNPCIQPCMHCSFIHSSFHACMNPNMYTSSIHPSTHLSMIPACIICLPIYPCIHQSVHLPFWCLSVCSCVRTVLSSYSTLGPEGSWSSCFFYIFLILNMKVFYLSCSTVWHNTD